MHHEVLEVDGIVVGLQCNVWIEIKAVEIKAVEKIKAVDSPVVAVDTAKQMAFVVQSGWTYVLGST